jgi:hypothetical protein
MDLDVSRWSGDGDFTQAVIAALETIPGIAAARVEDAPASRADSSFMFISNEVYLRFDQRERREPARWFGVVPIARRVREPVLTLAGVGASLACREEIGEADYSDDSMLQYLRTQRIVAPYQTRGRKLVELLRIYDAGARPAAGR